MTESLAAVIDGYLDLRWRLNPVEATFHGVVAFDGMFAAYDSASVRAQLTALTSYESAIEAAEAETLAEEIDRTAVLHAVRYEALGENNYAGMRGNLAAATDLRTRSDPIARASNESEVPLQTALSLMLREALTAQAIPESARAGVEMVRKGIEARIGDDFERLATLIDDQRARSPLRRIFR